MNFTEAFAGFVHATRQLDGIGTSVINMRVHIENAFNGNDRVFHLLLKHVPRLLPSRSLDRFWWIS